MRENQLKTELTQLQMRLSSLEEKNLEGKCT